MIGGIFNDIAGQFGQSGQLGQSGQFSPLTLQIYAPAELLQNILFSGGGRSDVAL